MEKIKVLIIDDSAVMRRFLTDTLSRSPRIEVVGSAIDPFIAVNKIKMLKPDVLTLDVEMPRMDGLTFLSKLMIASPMPVIMVSTLTEQGADVTLKALHLGAVDFMLKPAIDNEKEVQDFSRLIMEKVFMASQVKMSGRRAAPRLEVEEKFSADIILAKRDPLKTKVRSEQIVAIGASTGGTEVIDEILVSLPDTVPGIVITQHMPEKFTDAFANRVNTKTKILVREGKHGDRLYRGMALIAPGGRHMLLRADSNGYYIEVNDGPPVNRHKPSVDVLFRSVSQAAGRAATGILCTGMGNDGAAGLLEMKDAGAYTVGQNEASCIVYGMPREAMKLGATCEERDIGGIIDFIKNIQ